MHSQGREMPWEKSSIQLLNIFGKLRQIAASSVTPEWSLPEEKVLDLKVLPRETDRTHLGCEDRRKNLHDSCKLEPAELHLFLTLTTVTHFKFKFKNV